MANTHEPFIPQGRLFKWHPIDWAHMIYKAVFLAVISIVQVGFNDRYCISDRFYVIMFIFSRYLWLYNLTSPGIFKTVLVLAIFSPAVINYVISVPIDRFISPISAVFPPPVEPSVVPLTPWGLCCLYCCSHHLQSKFPNNFFICFVQSFMGVNWP